MSEDLVVLEDLQGQLCWSAAVGLSDSWLCVLDIGERQRRGLRLANSALSFLQRTYEGSYSLVIEGPWRIDSEVEVLGSCFEAREPDDRLQQALDNLVGQKIVSAKAESPAHDLELTFEDGLILRVFSLEPAPAAAVSVPQGETGLLNHQELRGLVGRCGRPRDV